MRTPKSGPSLSYRRLSKIRAGILLTFPAVVFIFIFLVYPLLDLIRSSFFDYSPLRSSSAPFVGVSNYRWMLESDTVWHSIFVTIEFTILSVAIELVLGLCIAVLLSKLLVDAKARTSRASRALGSFANGIFILPFAVPGIVAAIAWKMLLHPQFSPINALLGIQVSWFTDYSLLSIVVADSWKMTPMILFLSLSALLSIDNAQFEAARIDGANARQEFFSLTLPSVAPIIAIAGAFRAVDAFTKVFDIVFGTTGGGPGNDTQVFPLLIWQTAFNNLNFGKAAALAIFGIVVSLLLGSIVLLFRRAE
jgi:multiple sugar transport system permease protein